MTPRALIPSVALRQKLTAAFPAQFTLPGNLTAQAFLIPHLPPFHTARGILWCVPSHRELAEAAELINFWFGLIHPTNPTSTKVLKFPEDFIVWLHNHAEHKNNILLVAREHLSLALPSVKQVTAAALRLKTGQTIKLTEAIKRLISAGYEAGPLPDHTGWFQKIGGSLVLATSYGQWRLIWLNDQIELIELFSPESGLTIERSEQLTILPCRLEPDGHETLANYLTPGNLLLGFPPDLAPQHKLRINLQTASPNSLFANPPLFVKQWSELERWINNKLAARENICVLTSTPYRLPKTIVPKVHLVTTSQNITYYLHGFFDRSGGTHYLTDRELFGVPRPARRHGLSGYEKISLGDYLVHIDHGIGRFNGLVEKETDGQRREYLLIEYAEGDKLYVPVEQADRLSRYLGSPHPQLERLSSTHWFRVRKKIKKETAELANELLTLYAKRHLSQIKPWPKVLEEDVLAATFPYPLTSDQLKTWAEISADLESKQPMDRLICGDVGFGKTELAVRATARAAFNGYQTAVLAPTTILAQQHFDTFTERLNTYGLKIALVSRAQSSADIRHTLQNLAEGSLDVIIGTHRLLSKDVKFYKLGLLIIDEEQRFSVKQKERLRMLKPSVHVLALSATPIPRSLNLAVASLRDLSIILSPPAGRQAVKMHFAQADDRLIKRAVGLELKRGGQIFYLVQHIKDLPATEAKLLRLLPKLRIGVIHGRKPPAEVARLMHEFDTGKIDLLLATAIIENGLDLPQVNTLIVENAQNFGLADLYQLKGRVGRGKIQAHAYFLTPPKITLAADQRLDALAQTEELGSGMSLALKDLELRGAGSILGREQHGHASAVGLHLYGQMLADAIAEQRAGEPLPAIPEVRLNLPLEGRISSELVPDEQKRIHLYQRLASIREVAELSTRAVEFIGHPLGETKAERLFKNLLTILEIKLLVENARLQEVSCHQKDSQGRFIIRPLEPLTAEAIARLKEFDPTWHKVESSWQSSHTLSAGTWIPWLKQCLRLLQV